MKKIDLVILAGGKGSRIKKFLQNKPKPMMKFNNIYFLQYLINNFSKYPFNKIYILTGFKNKLIFQNFHNKSFNFIKIECIKEKYLMGTGGALYNLKQKKINDFVLTNGDTIFNIDLKDFLENINQNKLGHLALVKKNESIKSNKLNNLSLKKNILYHNVKSNLINGGIYFFKKKILKFIPERECSLENEILPDLIKSKLISGKLYNQFFLDIGSPKNLKVGSIKLKKEFYKPAVFLDRDGVINQDLGYVNKRKNFKFKKGVIKGLSYLIKKNYYIFVVTNQAGIAKGIFKLKDFFSLHRKLKSELEKKEIYFNDVQFAPYHPKGIIKKFRKKSNLRKPGNKMIINIFDNWLINKKKSFMIGDKISDKKCALKSKLFFAYAEEDFYNQVKKIIKSI